MKFIEVAVTFIAMFTVAAVALPHGHGHHGYDHDGDNSYISTGACNNEETSGILNKLLGGGILSNNEKTCVTNIKNYHH